jgi:hypothetical protein
MGFLSTLLTLPVSGPIKSVAWLAEKILEQAEQEYYNHDRVRGQLLQLELSYEMDEITLEEYLAAEEALLTRLQEIEAWYAQQNAPENQE